FILSRIELGDPRTAGQVVRPGTVLTLQAEGIPAKQMRVIQLNTKSPRFHVRDYAPVEVTGNGRVITGPGEFRLGRGARLSVLGLKVETDRIRFFTHTVEPVRFEGRQPVFGCTEFVFRFDAGVLERGDLGMVLAQIGKWLAPDPARAAAITLGPDRG
ncbi:MAG: hypothetical protein ACREJS_06275, partial [Candidatus Rokuibacteriota bacterium]